MTDIDKNVKYKNTEKDKVNNAVKKSGKDIDFGDGIQPFLKLETKESIHNDVLEKFLVWMNEDKEGRSLPPEDLITYFLGRLNKEIQRHNKDCDTSHNSSNKFSQYSVATITSAVGEIILQREIIRKVQPMEVTDKSMYDLAVYLPEKGIYSHNDADISKVIRRYIRSASEKQIDEVIRFFDRNALYVNETYAPNKAIVRNGIFDWETKTLEPFTPDFVAKSKLETDYNPKATNPHFEMSDGEIWDVESWLDSLTDDKETKVLLRQIYTAAAYSQYNWDTCFIPYSTIGNNGKGTYLESIRQMMGDEVCASISIDSFSERFSLGQLLYVKAILTDENDVNSFIQSSSSWKKSVTGDVISVDRKFQKPIKCKFRGFQMQCFNSYPNFKDTSDALLRRFLIIPFTKCFTGVERKEIKHDFLHRKEVREYLLKMALESDVRELIVPQVCIDAKEEFKVENDSLRAFVNEVVYFYGADGNGWEFYPMDFVYENYKAWFAEKNSSGKPLKQAKFNSNLKIILDTDPDKHFIEATICKNGKRKRVPKGSMDGYEPNIIEYELENYYDKSYYGNDKFKKANFKRPDKVRAYIVRNTEFDFDDIDED